MNVKAFAALCVVTVVAVAAAAWVTAGRYAGPVGGGDGELMFPDLAAKVNDVRRIKVTRSTGTATAVATTDKDGKLHWHLQELYDYPVPIQMIRAIGAGMARLRAVEPKTVDPAKYSRIHVGDPTKKGTKSARVQLFDDNHNKLADLIVGLDKGGVYQVGDVYVRRPGEARSWLAHGKVPVPDQLNGWVDQTIVDISLPRVREATVYVPGHDPLRVYKNTEDDRDFILQGLPEGYELKKIFGAEDIARMIQGLTFEQVKPAKDIGFDFSEQPRARHITFDGLIIETWLKPADGKKWLAFRARVNPDPAPVDKVDPAKAKAEAEKINATVGGWAYTVSDFQTHNLEKTIETMTEPKKGA